MLSLFKSIPFFCLSLLVSFSQWWYPSAMSTALSLCGKRVPSAIRGGVSLYLWCKYLLKIIAMVISYTLLVICMLHIFRVHFCLYMISFGLLNCLNLLLKHHFNTSSSLKELKSVFRIFPLVAKQKSPAVSSCTVLHISYLLSLHL